MKESLEKIRNAGLKITPQRVAVMKAMQNMKTHPTADEIAKIVIDENPAISVGTIYKTLETFVDKGIICMVKTDKGKMRYDPFTDNHHHIYDCDSGEIRDYHDDELNALLTDYFNKKQIPGLEIKELKLNIVGNINK